MHSGSLNLMQLLSKKIKRLYNIDVLRGLVMVIMVLDHVRDLMHTSSVSQSPTDLTTTTPTLFFTRWITHLCAPTFVFLAGASVFISTTHTNNLSATRSFLFKRGIWLIFLEFTVINFGLWFDITFSLFLFNVIATIGVGFILLSLLLRFSSRTIGIIGIAILTLHNLTVFVPDIGIVKNILMPFFSPTSFSIGNGKMFIMGYPPIPWLGFMLTGFAAAKLYLTIEKKDQQKLLLKSGLVLLLLFLVLRLINLYGDNAPWQTQATGFYSFLSFINVTKYPPSLQFSLLFIGLMFLVFAGLHSYKNKLTNILSVYGKVPLFYFVIHWYIIHPILFLIIYAQGYERSDMIFGFNFGRPKDGGGVELWAIFLIWLGVVLLLYPICMWYSRYKDAHPEKKWLRYL